MAAVPTSSSLSMSGCTALCYATSTQRPSQAALRSTLVRGTHPAGVRGEDDASKEVVVVQLLLVANGIKGPCHHGDEHVEE